METCLRSQRRVEDGVDVVTEALGVDPWKPRPVLEHDRCLETGSGQRTKLGNRLAGTGNDEMLTGHDPVDDLATVIA